MTRLLLFLARVYRRLLGTRASFDLALSICRILAPQMRHHWPEIDWLSNAEFDRYLEHFGEANGLNSHRRWTLSQTLRLLETIPGDTAECGVFAGASSWLICQWSARRPGRTHFVIDSFAGLSAPEPVDGDHWKQGDLAIPEATVRATLTGFHDVVFLAGWIPDVLALVPDRRFAFVHIDVDLHDPTFAAVSHFYPRVNRGGIILCDDYGASNCPGATAAIDHFLADKPEQMISLPCGGGLLVKGVPTGPSLF